MIRAGLDRRGGRRALRLDRREGAPLRGPDPRRARARRRPGPQVRLRAARRLHGCGPHPRRPGSASGCAPAGSTRGAARGTPGAPTRAPGPSSLTFAAGGRQREAAWHFDPLARTVSAVDDEARWLSEDEAAGARPASPPRTSPRPSRPSRVYDVEAEGGVRPPSAPAPAEPEGLDVPTRATSRRARSPSRRPHDGHARADHRPRPAQGGSRRGPRKAPTNLPGADEQVPDDAMPLEDLAYDPETMPPPPAAHAHPDIADPLDARPEPAAAAWAEAAGAALDQPDAAPPCRHRSRPTRRRPPRPR